MREPEPSTCLVAGDMGVPAAVAGVVGMGCGDDPMAGKAEASIDMLLMLPAAPAAAPLPGVKRDESWGTKAEIL